MEYNIKYFKQQNSEIKIIIYLYLLQIQDNMYSKGTLNTSAQALRLNQNNYSLDPLDVDQVQIYKKEKKKARHEGLSYLYQNDYKPAVYQRAVQYKNSLSYKKKLSNGTYKQIQLFEDTAQLKVFGLGPYFFIEFQRRVVWLFFAISLLIGITLYINWMGTGLGQYPITYSTYLIKSTLGNFNQEIITNGYDTYIISIAPCAVFFSVFIFYMVWKCHYSNSIDEEDQNMEIVKPQKFCIEVQGFKSQSFVRQEDLERIFGQFGPIYQVSMSRQYAGKLKYFEELDDLQQQIKEQQLQIVLGYGDKQNLAALKKQKQSLQKYINTLQIKPSTVSAYVHYQFQKSKVQMLSYYNDHYLFNSKTSHSIMRNLCCCCLNKNDPKHFYQGENLYVKNEKVPEPQDINWDHYEVGCCGKLFRVIFSCLIIIVFLALSCTIIGLCSIYIQVNIADCQGVYIPDTLSEAESVISDEKQLQCFCSAKLFDAFNDESLYNYCGATRINELATSTGIQYAITATSAIVNFLFGLIVDKLVNLTHPLSFSNGYMWKNAIYTIFIIFNTAFLPLLIYADIFGFKASYYVSFITIISTDIRNVFNVESISFYVDFERIWYRNVSPLYTNYIIIDLLLTWVFFIVYKCISSKQSLQDDQGKILQKQMNNKITSWKLNAYIEYSYFNLIIFLGLFFCAGIPVLIPLAFINLFSKYLTNRLLLQNNSSRIVGLSQSFNYLPMILIPFIMITAPLFNQWMLSGNDVVALNQTMKLPWETAFQIFNRQLMFPFYIILALIAAFQFFLYNTLIRFCSWMASCCHDKKKVVHPYYTQQYAHYAKSMSLLHSYNIRNNVKFKNAIFNLERYLQVNDIK